MVREDLVEHPAQRGRDLEPVVDLAGCRRGKGGYVNLASFHGLSQKPGPTGSV